MKIIVGLGNPGTKYEGTRHNVGFDVLFELTRRWQVERPRNRFEAEIAEAHWAGEKTLLVWPQTFMNLSGRSVGQIVQFFQVPARDVLVVCDDLNLKLGQLRLRASGSAGGQKGLLSILQVLSTEAVPRLRIGIDRQPAGVDSAAYVLAKFRKEELEVVDSAIRRAAAGVERWISDGIEAAMNEINAGEPPANRPSSAKLDRSPKTEKKQADGPA